MAICTRYYVGKVTLLGLPVPQVKLDQCTAMVADAYGGSSTVYQTVGYWPRYLQPGHGEREDSMVIEAIAEPDDAVNPRDLAGTLALIANQAAVLWTQGLIEWGFAP